MNKEQIAARLNVRLMAPWWVHEQVEAMIREAVEAERESIRGFMACEIECSVFEDTIIPVLENYIRARGESNT